MPFFGATLRGSARDLCKFGREDCGGNRDSSRLGGRRPRDDNSKVKDLVSRLGGANIENLDPSTWASRAGENAREPSLAQDDKSKKGNADPSAAAAASLRMTNQKRENADPSAAGLRMTNQKMEMQIPRPMGS